MSNIMLDMAKAEARYSNDPKKKLIGITLDPAAFVDEKSGELNSDALAHEGFEWVQKQFKKIDADKKAAAEAEVKKDG